MFPKIWRFHKFYFNLLHTYALFWGSNPWGCVHHRLNPTLVLSGSSSCGVFYEDELFSDTGGVIRTLLLIESGPHYPCDVITDDTSGWLYRSGTVNSNTVNSNMVNSNTVNLNTSNSNTVNSKFYFIQSFCDISVNTFSIISCLKCTVNSNFHLIRSKTLPTNDFELTVPDL